MTLLYCIERYWTSFQDSVLILVIYIISKSLLKNLNNIYIYIYIFLCPNITINEHKNYKNASTLINKVHRSGLWSQQGNIMEHAIPCSLIEGRPFWFFLQLHYACTEEDRVKVSQILRKVSKEQCIIFLVINGGKKL